MLSKPVIWSGKDKKNKKTACGCHIHWHIVKTSKVIISLQAITDQANFHRIGKIRKVSLPSSLQFHAPPPHTHTLTIDLSADKWLTCARCSPIPRPRWCLAWGTTRLGSTPTFTITTVHSYIGKSEKSVKFKDLTLS